MVRDTSVSVRRRVRTGLCSAALFGVALSLVGCDQQDKPPAPPRPAGPPPLAPEMRLHPVTFDALPGWGGDRPSAALPALRWSCEAFGKRTDTDAWVGPGAYGGTVADWQRLCAGLNRLLPPGQESGQEETVLRSWLRETFQPYAVGMVEADGQAKYEGTFTGYYEATLKGSLTRQPGYQVPLYGPPADLITVDMGALFSDMAGVKVVGRLTEKTIEPYWTRAQIDGGALAASGAPVVAWAADAVDAHILHIQGSGVLELPDGGAVQVGYAGNNGHKFVGIGRTMLDRGLVGSGQASMPAIRDWLKTHPDQAPEVLASNPRYIFFRQLQGPGPLGALDVPLTPGRSLAVDPRYVPLGVPLWLSSVDPDMLPLARLMVAQDVGSAIKGVVRGDFFWGSGESALEKAGRMKSPGSYYLLLPRDRKEAPPARP